MTDRPTIVFATNNAHKLREVREILGDRFNVVSLAEVGSHDDIAETAGTLEGNALIKARWVKEHYGYDCFADDTGLEVDCLGGEPGVNSARYAEQNLAGAISHDSDANMKLLLERMKGKPDRKARFRTAVALILGDKTMIFEGKVEGRILESPAGEGGFGYDPVFVPDGYVESFAQMPPEQKNSLSHRGRAVEALAAYLKES